MQAISRASPGRRRAGLSLGVAPGLRDARAIDRRPRSRGGIAPRGVRGRDRALVAGGRAGPAEGMARLGRPVQGHRRPPTADAIRRLGPGNRPAGSALAVPDDGESEDIEDDRLRLIFTCCHPALAHNTQVALTLREVCGLTTEEIAVAFLTAPATIAQRIVRGKAKIRDAEDPLRRALARGPSRSGWTRCSRSSTWCSRKGIRPLRVGP